MTTSILLEYDDRKLARDEVIRKIEEISSCQIRMGTKALKLKNTEWMKTKKL